MKLIYFHSNFALFSLFSANRCSVDFENRECSAERLAAAAPQTNFGNPDGSRNYIRCKQQDNGNVICLHQQCNNENKIWSDEEERCKNP